MECEKAEKALKQAREASREEDYMEHFRNAVEYLGEPSNGYLAVPAAED